MKRGKQYNRTEGRQLEQELERLRALTEGMDEIIYVSDPETYKILFVNKKTREIFGGKVLGKKCYEVFQKLNHPCPFCTNKHLFRKNSKKIRIRELQNHKNKQWYKCMDKAIKWPRGKYVRFGIAIDVTDRKRMEEALRENKDLFRSIVENSHNCILIIDDKFRIIYANDGAMSLSGYSKEEIVGQDFRKFLDEDSKALVQDRYVNRQRGKSVPSQYEFKIVRKDGKKRDVEIKSTIVQDRYRKTRTISQLLDITEHKRIEEERKSFEERLSALNKHAQYVSMAKSLEEIYALTLNAMEKTLGFEYASILMVEGKMLRLVTHRGYSEEFSLELRLDEEKGVTVKAARNSKPILIQDIRKEKAYVLGRPSILSELAVPIKLGNKVLGVLNVEKDRLAAFDQNDIELLEILASHTAIAISNLRRQEKLSALNIYGRSLNRAENMEEIYALTLNAMEKTLGFKFVDVFLVEGKMLRLAATRGLSKRLAFNLPLNGRKGVTVKASKTGPAF